MTLHFLEFDRQDSTLNVPLKKGTSLYVNLLTVNIEAQNNDNIDDQQDIKFFRNSNYELTISSSQSFSVCDYNQYYVTKANDVKMSPCWSKPKRDYSIFGNNSNDIIIGLKLKNKITLLITNIYQSPTVSLIKSRKFRTMFEQVVNPDVLDKLQTNIYGELIRNAIQNPHIRYMMCTYDSVSDIRDYDPTKTYVIEADEYKQANFNVQFDNKTVSNNLHLLELKKLLCGNTNLLGQIHNGQNQSKNLKDHQTIQQECLKLFDHNSLVDNDEEICNNHEYRTETNKFKKASQQTINAFNPETCQEIQKHFAFIDGFAFNQTVIYHPKPKSYLSYNVGDSPYFEHKIKLGGIVNDKSLSNKFTCPQKWGVNTKKYFILAEAGHWTYWHMDFAGTNIWYSIISGCKVFFTFKYCKTSLLAFLLGSDSVSNTDILYGLNYIQSNFNSNIVDKFICLEARFVQPGDLLLLPSDIHCVLTIGNGQSIGGNYMVIRHIAKAFIFVFIHMMRWQADVFNRAQGFIDLSFTAIEFECDKFINQFKDKQYERISEDCKGWMYGFYCSVIFCGSYFINKESPIAKIQIDKARNNYQRIVKKAWKSFISNKYAIDYFFTKWKSNYLVECIKLIFKSNRYRNKLITHYLNIANVIDFDDKEYLKQDDVEIFGYLCKLYCKDKLDFDKLLDLIALDGRRVAPYMKHNADFYAEYKTGTKLKFKVPKI